MEYRLNSRTYGYMREDRTERMQRDDRQIVMAEKMQQKRAASYEAEKYLKENLKKAIAMFEGTQRMDELMRTLDIEVFSKRMNAYGKLTICMNILKNNGVDTESGFWQWFLLEIKKKISEMTDPNKFYTY